MVFPADMEDLCWAGGGSHCETEDPVVTWVAGIDFSSRAIDIVLVDVDERLAPVWTRYQLSGQDAFDRTRRVGMVMPGLKSGFWDDVIAVGIEHPAGKFGTGVMMRVQGAVLAMLPSGVLVQPWPPSLWRKSVGLKGNASKADVVAFCLPVGDDGLGDWPQDAYDAYCIALATLGAIYPEEEA